VEVDPLDVTVWHNIGKISMSLKNFQLARHAFLQVLNSHNTAIIIIILVNTFFWYLFLHRGCNAVPIIGLA